MGKKLNNLHTMFTNRTEDNNNKKSCYHYVAEVTDELLLHQRLDVQPEELHPHVLQAELLHVDVPGGDGLVAALDAGVLHPPEKQGGRGARKKSFRLRPEVLNQGCQVGYAAAPLARTGYVWIL